MGQQLVQLYQFAKANGGSTAQMRVAMKSLIPANKAAETPDTAETVAKVRAAIKAVTGQDAPNL